MLSFALPFSVPEITVSLLWHPRLDADPAHRWLRGCVREVCTEQHTRFKDMANDGRELK
jgi:DNA-binding transcriptional LysR family regulator